MAIFETWLTADLQKMIKPVPLWGTVFSQDNQANLIGVRVYDGSEAAALGGSVSGKVIRADGATVSVSGTVSGNEASIVLPQAAYAVPGPIAIAIANVNGGAATTLAACTAYVTRTSTDTIIDPGTIIPSIDTLIAQIDAAIASIPADYSALLASIAPTFSTSTAYMAGQYVWYNGTLYRFTADHAAGTWDGTQAAAVNLSGDVTAVVFNLNELNCYNLFDNIPRANKTNHGITWTWNGDYLTASGTASAIENYSVYSNASALPAGMEAGKTYRVLHATGSITTKIYYDTAATANQLFNSANPGEFTIPAAATGLIIRFTIANGATVNETFAPVIVAGDVKTNRELVQDDINTRAIITSNYFDEKNALLALLVGHTINLLDPDAITSDYVLSNNTPTPASGWFYTDYMDISGLPFCYRFQGASVTNLVSCYDESKTYLGAIDYTRNTEYYKTVSDYAPKPTAYYIVTPLPGTKYVRVNGRYTSNLMLTPIFYPDAYIPYGQMHDRFAADSAAGLKIAMFGDSITYGTDGDDHSTPVSENLSYWVNRLAGFEVTNYGIGSMGWVSTQYSAQIAYDKISSTDLTPYDIVTLCYGVNDTGAVMGTYDSTDETTIMGQINKCVRYIGAQNPKARIIIIAPWNGASSNAVFPAWGYGRTVYFAASGDTSRTKTRGDLSDEERKLCAVYGIGFISQTDSPLNGFGLGTASSTTPGPYIGADLVHPSKDGYKAMGEWLAAKIKGIVV